jgi:hypothetical protein
MDKKLGPYHFDDIMRIVLDLFPEAELDEDNDGQLIIHTDWVACSSDGYYAPRQKE